MTKWSQKKPCTPKRIAQKALSGVLNGHICKNDVRRLARKAGPMPVVTTDILHEAVKAFGGSLLVMCCRRLDGGTACSMMCRFLYDIIYLLVLCASL